MLTNAPRCRMSPARPVLVALLVLIGLRTPLATADEAPLVLQDNLKVLKADAPDERYRFVGSNAPGQLFLPKETANLRFDFARGSDKGAVKDFAIELQEITTRDPDSRTKGGFTDTSGNAPLIGLEGQAVRVPLTVNFTDQPRTTFEIGGFPLPERFGTYALVLVRGDKRQFMGTLARLPQPRPDGTVDNTPIFGEGAMIGDAGEHAECYARMGVRGWRGGGGWDPKRDGTYDWSKLDRSFASAKKAGCQIMFTTSGSTDWTRPFGDPTPAVGWTPQTGGYGGTGDWLHRRDLDDKYGQWVEAFARRYWEGGKGGLWGIENYNEPWEGGGITGWCGDAPRYRELQKIIYTSVKKVDPRIKVLAASTIMNTEDKLYSDGSSEMDKYIDIFTDHYVAPVGCYGPMVARAHGKGSMETETWFVNSEYALPQGVVQFLASGQSHMSPWHPRVLFDKLPGNQDNYFIPTPVVVATAAFNYLATGKTFEKMVFPEHMPYAFQFGRDDDKDALVVVLGRLMPIGGNGQFKDMLWSQINSLPGGKITIDNRDGILEFYDLAANREHQGEASVTLPLSFLPTYIKSPKGPKAFAERLMSAKIEGRRPVEIVPHDFSCLPTASGAAVRVEVRNRLNRVLSGTLKATAPEGITLQDPAPQAVSLQPGESRTLVFPVAKASVSPANAYPFSFALASDAGNADYREVLNAAIVTKGTKNIDGNLDDWKDVPSVTMVGGGGKGDISEQLRRPWLDIQKGSPGALSGEFKLAWDDDFVYVAARVSDATPEENAFRFSQRDENSYFHSAASDARSPYKEFIEAYRKKTGEAKRSFAEVPYIYCKPPEAGIPFRRDRIQISFDVSPGYHDMQADTRVPAGFHAVPDTDYEYSAYWCSDGKQGGGELWRLLAPGVPRIHDWPHQVRGERTTGVVPGAKIAVKREGNVYVYEIAIPRKEMPDFPFKEGSDFGLAFEIGDSKNGKVFYAADKALTKNNGLTRHPYWESGPDASPRWTLVK